MVVPLSFFPHCSCSPVFPQRKRQSMRSAARPGARSLCFSDSGPFRRPLESRCWRAPRSRQIALPVFRGIASLVPVSNVRKREYSVHCASVILPL